ncbi:MAG: YncE family protein, partial [bacterium]
MSPHFRPIAINKGLVYVTNTPADTVDVIDSSGKKVISRIHVGVNPAGLAIRPGGRELWVANHVSDSVSIIDIDPASPLRFAVVATIQEIDPKTRSTRFDEPVGIVFAGHDKAYVSLSAENRIAVIDARSRRLSITHIPG